MIDDFKPADRHMRSLQASLDELPDSHSSTHDTEPSGAPFRTPDEVAADQTLQPSPPSTASDDSVTAGVAAADPGAQPSQAPSWKDRLRLSWPPGKKEWLVLVAVILLIGVGTAVWVFAHPSAKPVLAKKAPVATKSVAVVPTTVPSTLSGLPVNPSLNSGPVTAVMIENSDGARPQSGLSQAGVVFEAVAEGGVTRFMALYQDTAPNNVGPIRSARPYFVAWALGFDAGYAHVGGSPDGLADIRSWQVRDLDQFFNGSSYHRITTRYAPHNVYTAISTLNQLETAKGYTSSNYTGFARKAAAPTKVPTAATINLSLSGPDYNPTYNYNAATNSYDRSEGGAPQIGANTNARISPKVVIAMVTPEARGALDSSGAYYSNYQVIGSGPVDIFQDGLVVSGQWTKSSNTSQIVFTDAAGKTIPLDPGQTWITAVTSSQAIAFTP